MAQLDYFGTWSDSRAMLQEVFAHKDTRACWDAGPHDHPNAQTFTTLTDELWRQVQRRPRVFIFGDFSTHPPLFWEQDRGANSGRYFLSQSGGGPLISFSLARDLQVDGEHILALGMISTQPRYELTPGHWEKPSPALKTAYADLVKRLKKHLVRYQDNWIGPEALRLLQAGQVKIPRSAVQPPQRGGSTPPAAPLPRAAAER